MPSPGFTPLRPSLVRGSTALGTRLTRHARCPAGYLSTCCLSTVDCRLQTAVCSRSAARLLHTLAAAAPAGCRRGSRAPRLNPPFNGPHARSPRRREVARLARTGLLLLQAPNEHHTTTTTHGADSHPLLHHRLHCCAALYGRTSPAHVPAKRNARASRRHRLRRARQMHPSHVNRHASHRHDMHASPSHAPSTPPALCEQPCAFKNMLDTLLTTPQTPLALGMYRRPA